MISIKIIMDMMAIITALITEAKAIARVTSAAERGAYKISTIFPWILPIIKDEDEWENDCWIICIAIKPGARKVINWTPNISPLPLPKASDKTIKNKRDDMRGEIIVWIQTIRNLSTSFLNKVQNPIQLT